MVRYICFSSRKNKKLSKHNMKILFFGLSRVCLYTFILVFPLSAFAVESIVKDNTPLYSSEIEAILKKDPSTVTQEEDDALFDAMKQRTDAQNKQNALLLSDTSCFDHYHFGSVKVDLSAALKQTVSGAPMSFFGVIKNENSYPIVNGSVYVKIFRTSNEDDALIAKDGYTLVDQFSLPEIFNIAANGEKPAAFDWHVPANAEGGEYYAAFFFQSAKRYNLLGLSFTDDVIGNVAPFLVTNQSAEKLVTLDKHSVTLNGKSHAFARFPMHFAQKETVIAKIPIKNPKKESSVVSLEWKLYSWDALREETLGDIRTEVIELKSGEVRNVEYTVPPTGSSVAYLVLKMNDGTSNSFLNIRFIRDGISETRINFPSVETYPLEAGRKVSIFSCVHSTNFPVISDNVLTLTLKDTEGNIIHSYTYEGDVTGDMMGVTDTFTPEKTYATFDLIATLTRSGQVMEEVTQHYNCQQIDPSLCPKSGVSGVVEDVFDSVLNTVGIVVVGAIALVGIVMIFLSIRKKRNRMIRGFIFVVMFGLSIGAGQVEAKSTTFDVTFKGNFTAKPFGRTAYSFLATGTYTAEANYTDDATVLVGSTIDFSTSDAAVQKTTSSWFIPGYVQDSPFVTWVSTFAEAVFLSKWAGEDIESPWYVTMVHPGVSLSHGSRVTCSGLSCKVTSAGPIVIKVKFAKSKGTAFNAMSNFDIPAKEITFNFTGAKPNSAPVAPSISGNGGNVGEDLSFSFKSKDADDDNVTYLVDWNNDGTGDQWTPVWPAFVASNTASSASHAWWTGGEYTLQARALDSQGNYSGWTQKTITITPNIEGVCGVSSGLSFSSAPTIGLCSSGTETAVTGVGPWNWKCKGSGSGATVNCKAFKLPTVSLSANPLTVNMGSQTQLTWSTVGAVGCTASSNDASWSGSRAISNAIGESATPTADPTTYTLTCHNASGGSTAASVDVNLSKFLKICENSCDSFKDAANVTMNQNQTKHLKACYNPILISAPNKCTNVTGNITGTAIWSKTSDSNNVVKILGGELTSNPRNGVATIRATYASQQADLAATVICIPIVTCNSLKSQTDTYCPEITESLGKDDCDNPISCPGTRKCNYNFRESQP